MPDHLPRAHAALGCAAGGCPDPAATFRHFPTVTGYCFTHGNVVTGFLSLIDACGPIGFDGVRARWEIVLRQRSRLE